MSEEFGEQVSGIIWISEEDDTIQVSRAEYEALKLDAERYRKLRSHHWNSSNLFVVAGDRSRVVLGTDCPSHDRLDAAIDAAINMPANGEGRE